MPLGNNLIQRSLLSRKEREEERKNSKLRKRAIKRSDQYDIDTTYKADITRNDTLGNAIKLGIIAAAGFAAYKSGAMKPVASGLIDIASNFANTGAAESGAFLRAAKKWSNASPIETATQEMIEKGIGTRHMYSIFRSGMKKTFSNQAADPRGMIERVAEDSANDLRDFVNIFWKSEKENVLNRSQYLNKTRIAEEIGSIKRTLETNKNMKGKGNVFAGIAMNDELIKNRSLSAQKRAQQFKESGHSSITLGDIFEATVKNGTPDIKVKEGFNTNLLDPNFKATPDSKSLLESFTEYITDVNTQVHTGKILDNGNEEIKKLIETDLWKNLVIDPNLMISEDGKKIANMMMPRETLGMFWDSLKNDFKLPVVQFNPIKSFMNTIGENSVIKGVNEWLSNDSHAMKFGFAEGNSQQDAITKQAGKSIREWAVEKYGEDFANTNLIIVNDKAFITNEHGGHHIQVADHMKWYNIHGKYNANQVPYSVNAMREMSGRDFSQRATEVLNNKGEIEQVVNKSYWGMDISIDEWRQRYNEYTGKDPSKFQEYLFKAGKKLGIGFQEARYDDETISGIDESLNLDQIADRLIGKASQKVRGFTQPWTADQNKWASETRNFNVPSSFGFTPEGSSFVTSNNKRIPVDQMIGVRQAYTVGEIIQNAKEHGFNSNEFLESIQGLVAQYGSGYFKDGTQGAFFTEATATSFGFVDALNSGLDKLHLGLPTGDKRNAAAYMGNLMLKRALPAYMLMQVPGMINYFSEPFFTAIDKSKHKNDPDHDDTQYHNIGQWAMNHIVRPIDVVAHQAMDLTGVTSMFKKLQDLTPGSDQINELPGIYHLGLGQTTAEREDYIEKGYDPIRKGRWWAAGNTPFTGTKIEYWRANAYRRVNADVKFSGSKYGSRQEYYDNTWFPNAVNPLAPLNHFVLDRHHWDNKHYLDRPYLVHSGDALTQMPLLGPIFDAIERPFQGKMHKEYWKHGRPVNIMSDEMPSPLLIYGNDGKSNGIINAFKELKKGIYADHLIATQRQAEADQAVISDMNEKISETNKFFDILLGMAQYQSKLVVDKGTETLRSGQKMNYRTLQLGGGEIANERTKEYNDFFGTYTIGKDDEDFVDYIHRKLQEGTSADKVKTSDTLSSVGNRIASKVAEPSIYSPTQKSERNSSLSISQYPRDYDRYGTPTEIYRTASGRLEVVDVPDDLNLFKVNKELQHYSLNKIYGTNRRVNIEDYIAPGVAKGNDLPQIDNYFKYSLGEGYEQLTDIAGLKGFMIKQFITGRPNQYGAVIESSGYSYTKQNEFWDANLGGLGGELSEISRRFIPKKNNHIEYINPIRNTQPNWMPGRNYFIDFLHGDPYTKVKNGEERIAGEGYERLNNITGLLNINLEDFGKTTDQYVRHFLHQDEELTWDERQAEKRDKVKSEYIDYLESRGIQKRQWERDVKKHKRGSRPLFSTSKDERHQRSIVRQRRKEMGEEYLGSRQEAFDNIRDMFTGQDTTGYGYGRSSGSSYQGSFLQMSDDLRGFFGGYTKGHEFGTNKGRSGKIRDVANGIKGKYDMAVEDPTSPTGTSIMKVRSVNEELYKQLRRGKKVTSEDLSQLNYQLWATSNGLNKGYIKYINADNPNESFEKAIKFNRKKLSRDLVELHEARKVIEKGLKSGAIGRGELYPLLDRFRILADVAPYSQEFSDVKAKLAHAKLTKEQQEEKSQILERVKKQKDPLRIYDYKFSNASDTKKRTVTVSEVIDNNTLVVKEFGREHAIRFAGIRVSESNTEKWKPHKGKYRDKAGRMREGMISRFTRGEAASRFLNKNIKKGQKITIEYNDDPANMFEKNSTSSINAIVYSHGRNLNRIMLNNEMANERKNDNSAVGIKTRYGRGEIAFGSAMETLNHKVVSKIPFVGSKMLQVKSAYESYRDKEVYGKDFQSWNHPIRDLFIPNMVDRPIADKTLGGLFSIGMGAFIGSLFGKTQYGKIAGAVIGASIPAIGKVAVGINEKITGKKWKPKRRRDQEEINTYIDRLKYVKNMGLFNKYADKALKEDNFDVRAFIEASEMDGKTRKERKKELEKYKKKVKLDFSHHRNYNFEYGKPLYVQDGMSRKEVISAINKEIANIDATGKKLVKAPLNAQAAIEYRNRAQKTMYAYEPGSNLSDFMAALPKKDRDYFQHFIKAPKAERKKILDIVPEYMKRPLQFAYGERVGKKEDLTKYFAKHALPDANWEGWDEDKDLDLLKVKLVNKMHQDPGEFNIWDDQKQAASQVDIPIPKINKANNAIMVQERLKSLMGSHGMQDIRFGIAYSGIDSNNVVDLDVDYDERDNTREKIERFNERYYG